MIRKKLLDLKTKTRYNISLLRETSMEDVKEFEELLEYAYKTIAELHTRITGLELEQLEMRADIEKYKSTIEILRRL